MNLASAKETLSISIYQKLRKAGTTPKHIKFAAEYMTNGMNAIDAYLKHVARKNISERSMAAVAVEASRILRNPKIQDAIKEIFDIWLSEKKNKLEKEIIAALYARAFYDPTMFINADGSARIKDADQIPEKWRPAIDGIETRYYGKDADRKVVVWKLANRSQALLELSKYIKLYQDSLGLNMNMSDGVANTLKDIFDDKK